MAPGAKHGCKTCHNAHARCDGVRPTCGTCRKAGRECPWWDRFEFRYEGNPSINTRSGSHDKFPVDQTWPTVAQKVVFIDETVNLRLIYDAQYVETQSSVSPDDAPINKSQNTPPFRDIHQLQSQPIISLGLPSPAVAYPYESRCGSTCTCLDADTSFLEPFYRGKNRNTSSIRYVRTLAEDIGNYQRSPIGNSHAGIEDSASLLTHQEAYLLRHFIDELSSWFDLCDKNCHFARIAPRRALTNPTLLNSICAVSARHLSRVGSYDKYIADDYYQVCLQTLIPALDKPTALQDETLFAATVILRLYEELNVSLAGNDPEGHLLGAQILLNAQKYTEMSSGLRQGAFWVALRQEINIAITSERPIQLNFEQCNLDLSFAPGTEGTWAYRSIIHCAAVVQFCYSGEIQSTENWKQLVEYNFEWMRCKPYSFEPLYYRCGSMPNIPEIIYLENIHVTAAQHHTLARILLTAFNPRNSRPGLDIRFVKQSSLDIKHYVFETIGVAYGNPKTPAALFASCIAILSFITHFTDPDEQELLLSVLRKAENEHGWVSRRTQSLLENGG